mmetsp:Transcript_46677/g.117439  ORF Transcript_46677/g.117439 Transcript_46677/m.117439 type:complete len:682 (-) Transcript_46677:371-2416(-)
MASRLLRRCMQGPPIRQPSYLHPMSVETFEERDFEQQMECDLPVDVETPLDILVRERHPLPWQSPLVTHGADSSEEDDERYEDEEDSSPIKLSHKRSALFLVFIVNFIDSLGGSISTPILAFYAKGFDTTYAQVGQLFSVFALAQMSSMPFLSFASDRYGRRAVLLIATLGTGIGATWQGTATSYGSLLVSRIFSGIWSGVAPVCQVYLVDIVSPDLRVDYVSYLNSSTQASVLFGPSIGAGLSALGLQVPLYVQATMSFVLCLIVMMHLPESPAGCRLDTSACLSYQRGCTGTQKEETCLVGGGWSATYSIILRYGVLSFCGMVAQMAISTMFAVYAESTYQLGSVHVGFIMTLGAIASVGTNIWVSPLLLRRAGETGASLLGFALISIGSCGITLQPLFASVLGFMFAYQGLAIHSSAIAIGAANMTDSTSRATIMTGIRMMKSLGAVVGPILSGHLASSDIRLPFAGAAGIAMTGFIAQLMALPLVASGKDPQKATGKVCTPRCDVTNKLVDEPGTQEDIRELGVYLADILTSRHYQWITYNKELKNFLSDCFPPVSTEFDEDPLSMYGNRRRLRRARSDLSNELSHKRYSRRRYLSHHNVGKLNFRRARSELPCGVFLQLPQDQVVDCPGIFTRPPSSCAIGSLNPPSAPPADELPLNLPNLLHQSHRASFKDSRIR